MNNKMNRKNNHPSNKNFPFSRKYIVLLIVCIITGFIIGISYNLTKDKRTLSTASPHIDQENKYLEDLIAQKERNKELAEELAALEKNSYV